MARTALQLPKVFPLALCVVGLMSSCGSDSGQRTQLLVVVDAEDGLAADLERLRVELFERSGEGEPLELQEIPLTRGDPAGGRFVLPVSFAIEPRDVTARFRLVLTGFDRSDPIVEQRVITGFQTGQRTVLRIILFDDCRDVLCEDTDQTCIRRADCEAIPELVDELPVLPAGSGGELEVDALHTLIQMAATPVLDTGDPGMAPDAASGAPDAASSRTDAGTVAADGSVSVAEDCLGTPGGAATQDMCGTCDEDPSNDCTQDCAGTWGGSASEDMCGNCDTDTSNDCTRDCAGSWGGGATEDLCGTCDADPDNDCVIPSCDGAGDDCQDDGVAVSCCESKPVVGGTFPMGRCGAAADPCSDAYDGGSDELPEHSATVADFRLDTFEVTVGRFRRFVAAYMAGWRPSAGAGVHPLISGSGWQSGWDGALPADGADLTSDLECDGGNAPTWTSTVGAKEQYPITCTDWYVAFAFCIWDGGRLPTEAEWEYAAAGADDNRLFPWGPAEPDQTLAVFGCLSDGLPSCASTDIQPVGSRPLGRGRFGHNDLAGGVGEWALDWHADTWYSGGGNSCSNCANLATGTGRVRRGGSFGHAATAMRATFRTWATPNTNTDRGGVRCARDGG